MEQVKYNYPIKHLTVHEELDLAYCECGQGDQTLLFVHGLANYLSVWNLQLAELQSKYKCIAVDLPGNGFSNGGDYPYTMFFYAETIARFIEKKQLKNVTLVGHSMGGQVAMILAIRYPQILEKLVLIAPSGFEVFSSTEIMMTENTLDFGQAWGMDTTYLESTIQQSFYVQNPESKKITKDLTALLDNHSKGQWHKMVIANIKSMLKDPIHPHLDQIKHPTLIIFGEKDAMIPNPMFHFMETTKYIAQKASQKLENCELKLIPLAGHFVQIEKAPEVNQCIQQFLQKQ